MPPPPAQRVSDYAGVLAADARQRLETRLAERERATGAQMVIAIFASLEGESLEDFAIRLAERWRIGDRRLDRGVILLVFVQERRVRMEVGYGLEAVLPDAAAGQIIREALAPRFREQRYGAGLEAAVEAVFARIETRGVPPAPSHRFGVSPWVLGLLVVFGVVGLLLAREVTSGRRARRTAYTIGGRRGWESPTAVVPPILGGWGDAGSSGTGGFDFTPGGGSFGGGGASGQW